MLERIDHIVSVTGNLAAAVEPHEKLGLVFTPEGRNDQTGISNRACFVGTSPANYTCFEVLTVNVRGTFLPTKHVLPTMIAQRYGKIVNISGTSGLRGYPASMLPSALTRAMFFRL